MSTCSSLTVCERPVIFPSIFLNYMFKYFLFIGFAEFLSCTTVLGFLEFCTGSQLKIELKSKVFLTTIIQRSKP